MNLHQEILRLSQEVRLGGSAADAEAAEVINRLRQEERVHAYLTSLKAKADYERVRRYCSVSESERLGDLARAEVKAAQATKADLNPWGNK